ncbi:MAG: MTH1187 family thiamine-binding protein [Candidatus Bathyarchaeia archaeon]
MDSNHLVMAEFSIVPIGTGETSVGRFVATAVLAFSHVEGLSFEVTPMGTVLAANDLDTIFEAVRRAHEAVVALGARRVSSTLKIDDRRDKPRSMHDKVDAVKKYMKEAEANSRGH